MTENRRRFFRSNLFRSIFYITFSFFLGWMFAFNFASIDKTCKLDQFDVGYDVTRNTKSKGPELIVLILSAPKNWDKRKVVRETWLSLPKPKSKTFSWMHFFVIGTVNLTNEAMIEIKKEQVEFKDVLLLPIEDSYKNLTTKVLKSYEWLNEQYDSGLTFKFVLKCDDDSFVLLDNLVHEVKHLELLYLKSTLSNVLALSSDENPFIRTNVQSNPGETKNNLSMYWGYFDGGARVKKSGKWSESDWVLCDKYVPYALGGGYVLSKALVSYLARNSDYLRTYHSEDVSVGLWLAAVNNVLRIHDIRFDTEWTSRGCQNFLLVLHNISKDQMYEFVQNIKSKGTLCSKEYLNRNFYYYNWRVPPSQCCVRTKVKKIQ